MKYIASTICFVTTITLTFFLSSVALSPQFELMAQVKQIELPNQTETIKPEAKTLQSEGNNQCPGFPMPIIDIPLNTEQLKIVVKPNEKIDYKLIMLDPCLPKPTTDNNETPNKTLSPNPVKNTN